MKWIQSIKSISYIASPKLLSLIRLFISILFLMFLTMQVKAQDCDYRVEQARVLYNAGQLSAVVDTLIKCKSIEDEDIRLNVHRLLALAYIGLNENEQARKAVIILLDINPRYEPSLLNDPTDFVRMVRGVTVIPKLSLGVSASLGLTYSLPNVSKVYSLVEQKSVTYTGRRTLTMAVSSSFQFNQNWGSYLDFIISRRKFDLDYSITDIELIAKEHLTYAMMPIGVSYNSKSIFGLVPSLHLGIYGAYLMESKADYSYINSGASEQFSLLNTSTISRRNRLDIGIHSSLELAKQWGNGQASISVHYTQSFSDITNDSERYSYTSLARDYFYLDDDLKINTLSLMFGYKVYINYKVIE